MATGITTTSTIYAPDRTFYNRLLLERALPYLVHDKFGQMRPVPQNQGDQPKFRRYESLPTAIVPIVEDVIPSSIIPTITDVTGALEYYGSYIKVTDRVTMTSQDKVITEFTTINAEQMGESLDEIYRDALVAGTSVYRAGNVARASIALKLTKLELQYILRALRINKAKPFTEIIPASTGVGTVPIAEAYYAICSPYAWYDLQAILTTDLKLVHQYSNPSAAMQGEMGAFENLRFIVTTKAKEFVDGGGSAVAQTLKYTTANTACDVATMLIFGKNAYGSTALSGATEVIVEDRTSGGVSNPLHQFATVGWKAATDCIILNNSFMYRYEFGVSA
jgi:N4-gp56 family major capsid protein